MKDLNRIKQLAGLNLNESDLSKSNISWNIEDDGMYVTGTWEGSQGPIEMLADGYETMDGYWKISFKSQSQLSKGDVPTIKQAFVEWFKHAKNVDFGDDSKLSVDDVNVKIPSIQNVSMRKFARN